MNRKEPQPLNNGRNVTIQEVQDGRNPIKVVQKPSPPPPPKAKGK
jgi:hypothetical protein